MTSTRFLTTIALALALALAGIGCDPPAAPDLSSSNRNERLQAVRQTQEKWGTVKPSKTANEQTIVGRWNYGLFGKYLLFNADGTFEHGTVLASGKGTYRLLSNDIIELNYPGSPGGPQEFPYRLIGDNLRIENVGLGSYTRSKP